MATAKIEVWGAGAGGGGGGGGAGAQGAAGGGGSGAESILNAFPIVSGITYSLTVGTGGPGSTNSSPGGTGNDSWFDSTLTVLAKGGLGGTVAPNGTGGTGGQASAGIGDTKTSGGTGGSASGQVSGKGGDAPNGGTGGASVTAGVTGDDPRPGLTGNVPGGGGSGSSFHSNTGVFANGGPGANGQVVITVPLGVISSAVGGTHTTGGGNDIWTFTSSGTWTPTFVAGGGFLLNFIS